MSNKEDLAALSADAHLDDSSLLAAYVEGRVSDEERRLVTEYLTVCVGCRAALAALARGMEEPASSPAGAPALSTRRPRFREPATYLPVAAGLAVATVTGIFLTRTPPASNAPAAPPSETAPSSAPPSLPGTPGPDSAGPSAEPPRPDRPAGDVPVDHPSLLARRGGERRVGDKTFRLVAGEWIDTAYDPISGLPEVRTATAEETTAVIGRMPALRSYAALGDRVLVVLDGTVYRLRGVSRR